jgi:hypothetical protein
MEMGGQIHAQTILHPKKGNSVPAEHEAGWAWEPVGTILCREEYVTQKFQ